MDEILIANMIAMDQNHHIPSSDIVGRTVVVIDATLLILISLRYGNSRVFTTPSAVPSVYELSPGLLRVGKVLPNLAIIILLSLRGSAAIRGWPGVYRHCW